MSDGNGTNGKQNTAIQPANPQQQKMITFKDYIEARKSQLATLLPKHMSPDRIIKVALAAISKNPALLSCSIESVYMAIRQSSELGLEPGSALGHAYLVPYKGSCTLIPGYKGLIDLARRSGEIQSIEAHPVYQNDKFDLAFGLTPRLEHVPCLEGDPGPLRFVYAICKLKDGGQQLEVMTRAQIDKIMHASPGKTQAPWTQHYDEMARKTVVRRLIKYLPLSSEKARQLADAIELDDAHGAVIDVTAIESEPANGQTRTAAVLEQAKEAEKTQEPERDPNTGEVIPPAPAATSANGKVQIRDEQ